MSSHLEIERKYVAGSTVALPDLAGLDGVDRAVALDPVELDATYYDTADLRLAAHRVTLRRRTGGADDGWHLKLPAPGDAREEIRAPLGRGRSVPRALSRLMTGLTRDDRLLPVARITTTRATHQLYGSDGAVLAEVADDRVTGKVLGDPVRTDTWRELEVELVDGQPGLLELVEDSLGDAGARPDPSPSKLARILGSRVQPTSALAPVERLRKRVPVGQVALAYLREQVAQLLTWDPEVRRDTEDSVHKARVAARRMRSALRTYRPLLSRDVTDPIRDELKWLGQVLGSARDHEVMRDRLLAAVSTQPPELVVGPVVARLRDELGGGYHRAHRDAVREMSRPRYFTLLDRLEGLVADPPFTPVAEQPAGEQLPRLARRTWKRVRRLAGTASDAPDGEERDRALHEVRKAAKRARYAAESMIPVYGDDAAAFAARMEDVQEVLGEHQDGVVTRTALRAMGMRAHLAGENGFTFGLLAGLEEGRADRALESYAQVWDAASRRRLRRWMRT